MQFYSSAVNTLMKSYKGTIGNITYRKKYISNLSRILHSLSNRKHLNRYGIGEFWSFIEVEVMLFSSNFRIRFAEILSSPRTGHLMAQHFQTFQTRVLRIKASFHRNYYMYLNSFGFTHAQCASYINILISSISFYMNDSISFITPMQAGDQR